MAKKKAVAPSPTPQSQPGGDRRDGRSRNRVMDRDIWDADGLHWELVSGLDPERAQELFLRHDVRAAVVWTGGRTLEWIAPADRKTMWRDRFAGKLLTGRLTIRDTLPAFHAQLWQRPGDLRMVVIQQEC